MYGHHYKYLHMKRSGKCLRTLNSHSIFMFSRVVIFCAVVLFQTKEEITIYRPKILTLAAFRINYKSQI